MATWYEEEAPRPILSDATRAWLREKVRELRQAPAEHGCSGCGRDLRDEGYSLACTHCAERNRRRRRRGHPDGWRIFGAGDRMEQYEWRYSEAWKDPATDPIYCATKAAVIRRRDNRRRQAAQESRKLAT